MTDTCRTRALARDQRLIVGATWCPHTQKALRQNFTTNSVMLNQCPNGKELRAMLIKQTSWETIPLVFDGPHLIGGCDELVQFMRKNKR